ncbi:cytochrome P450 [Boeremia exigua]|uniref:cytochrome P450 n=1 Tax=Boeremia exigua TaxID=749465 RepID=UPI001E8E1539|nr:cytochrome P450 [Boeremia exigua]KAH6644885.1 cytochrome P450 [Boeremia exigua]
MLSLLLSSHEALWTLALGGSLIPCAVLLSSVRKHGLTAALLHPYNAIKNWLTSWLFLVDAPRLIQEGYEKAQGRSYTVDSPDVRYHLVTDPKLIDEIDRAPNDVLSLQAAAKVLLRPEHSMHKFSWFEKRGIDNTPLPKTVRTLLRKELPSILPKTRVINSKIMETMLSGPGKQPHISQVVRECVAQTCAIGFFGEELANDKEFMKAAEDFIDRTVYIAEAARILPGFFGRLVVKFLESYFSSQHVLFNALEAVAQRRIEEHALGAQGHAIPEHKDCIQYIMELTMDSKPSQCILTGPWAAGRITHELMALWFGAVHTMAMVTTFAIRDASMNPEYLDVLRSELESPAYEQWEATGAGMPFLDSFLKESARLNPLDNVSTRRKALQPMTLSDGTHAKAGEWFATPLAAMLKDAGNWAEPLEFHGFRHVAPEHLATLENNSQFSSPEPEKAALLTDVSKWQTWGTGRMAW